MALGYKVFVKNASGISMDTQHEFMDRLKKRTRLQQVDSVDQCDVTIAFVPVVSRVGTDIEAALKNIPNIRPIFLIVLHHTYDEHYVAPESRFAVNTEGVHFADMLWCEDKGLLRCLTNDKALKSISDHLSPEIPLLPVVPQPRRRFLVYYLIGLSVLIVLILLSAFIYLLVQEIERDITPFPTQHPNIPNITETTQHPNINVTTQHPYITNITVTTVQPNITAAKLA